MKKKFFCSIVGACLLLAEDSVVLQDITTQDEAIIDGASYKSEDIVNNPGSRSVLSNKQLKQSGHVTIDAALQEVPGVQVREYSGTGVLPKLQFRGFGGAGNGHTNTGLILLDGNNVYGGPYSNIELAIFPTTFQMVERIDVIKGGASVQYGPNTFSSVINIISKEIPKEWENEISERITFWGKDTGQPFNSKIGLANNMLFDTFLRSGGMIGEHFGIQAQANIIGGQSFRENSDTSVQNYKLDAIYKINANHVFKGFYQYYYFKANDPGSLGTKDYYNNRFQNLRPNQYNSGIAKRMGVSYNWFFGSGEKFDGDFSLNYYFHDATRNFVIDQGRYNQVTNGSALTGDIIIDNLRRFVVNTFEPKANFRITTGSVKQNIVVGARYTGEDLYYSTYHNGVMQPKTTKGTNYYNNFWAFYISDEIKFFDEKLSINPGLRYELLNPGYSNIKDGVSNGIVRETSHQFNPAVSITYKPIKDLVFYANYQKSFLPPQTGDITGTSFEVTTTFQNTEVGARYFLNPYVSFNATYFAIFADNYRIGRFAQGLYGVSALSQGVELETYITPVRGLNIHLAYSFTDARVANHKTEEIHGKFLPYVSPHQFSFDATYDIPKFATLGISGYYYAKSYSDIMNTKEESMDGKKGQLPDYFVFNAQISRTLWKHGKQRIDGSLGINNLFNAKYYFRGIGTSPAGRQPAPGRSVTCYVSYKF
ncbi:TonB-dependent receptor family protein [Helicobacter anatolicus]|uniref:TonB-dependent receptor family protein n=1 Tax=Helicobacter anatolicus TaxID=2905874 RepID=UPI001E545E72|nr:TonB-dependent receptor [Helicobacter anatolicus]MCE3038112.1 TonB-dependent receptor [Helicobacter anatolicus]